MHPPHKILSFLCAFFNNFHHPRRIETIHHFYTQIQKKICRFPMIDRLRPSSLCDARSTLEESESPRFASLWGGRERRDIINNTAVRARTSYSLRTRYRLQYEYSSRAGWTKLQLGNLSFGRSRFNDSMIILLLQRDKRSTRSFSCSFLSATRYNNIRIQPFAEKAVFQPSFTNNNNLQCFRQTCKSSFWRL